MAGREAGWRRSIQGGRALIELLGVAVVACLGLAAAFVIAAGHAAHLADEAAGRHD